MTRRLDHLTRLEVEKLVQGGLDTVIVPLGALEQHGPHLPLGTDTIIASVLAERTAEKLGALVAPPLPYGFSFEHVKFTGTVTLQSSTLQQVVKEICVGLASHGFKKIILLVGHFGNSPVTQVVAQELVVTTDTIVAVSNYFAGMERVLLDALNLNEGDVEWGYFLAHGGALETAFVLAHNESLVRLDVAEGKQAEHLHVFVDDQMRYPFRIEEASPAGWWGDPKAGAPGVSKLEATRELGEQLTELVAKTLAWKFRKLMESIEAAKKAATSA